jgi:hypothetical protein
MMTVRPLCLRGQRNAVLGRDPLHIAVFMNGSAVLIGRQIDRQVEWLAANCARCFWKRVTTHNAPPLDGHKKCMVKHKSGLINNDQGIRARFTPDGDCHADCRSRQHLGGCEPAETGLGVVATNRRSKRTV